MRSTTSWTKACTGILQSLITVCKYETHEIYDVSASAGFLDLAFGIEVLLMSTH